MTKKILIFLMIGISGAGFYLYGTHALESFTFFSPDVHRVEKKISVVKPKKFYSDRRSFRGLSAYKNENFSFFRVLNDPSMSKMVGLNGNVFKKHQFFPVKTRLEKASFNKPFSVPIIRVDKNNEYKTVPTITPIKVKKTISQHKGEPVQSIRAESRRIAGQDFPVFHPYAVQVSSFRQLERANGLKGILAKRGYASFIGKTKLPNNKGTWHRVYIGRYLDRAGAEVAAAKVQREEKLQAMVILRHSG